MRAVRWVLLGAWLVLLGLSTRALVLGHPSTLVEVALPLLFLCSGVGLIGLGNQDRSPDTPEPPDS